MLASAIQARAAARLALSAANVVAARGDNPLLCGLRRYHGWQG